PVNIGAMGDQVLYRLQVSFPRSHQQRRSVAAQLSVNVRLAVYQVFYKIKMSVSGSSHKRRFVARRVKFNVRTRGHEQFANGEVAVSGGRNQRGTRFAVTPVRAVGVDCLEKFPDLFSVSGLSRPK